MNIGDYIALGGLERLLIIGAAILICYWGYRLYGRAQIPGLAMIAVSALVLMSVILTSEQHQQGVTAARIATSTSEPAATVAMVQDQNGPAVSATDLETVEPTPGEVIDAAQGSPTATDADVDKLEPMQEPVVSEVALETDDTAMTADDGPEVTAPIERLVPLASGQELGGRIVSVRSENVTLEWSADDGRRRIISDSSKP